MEELTLSVVVPCKNEEANIARCLDSLYSSIPSQYRYEIIIVDCSSLDKTAEIAQKYPVKIYQIRDCLHTPAAARHTGTKLAKGRFIFFIDADMTLDKGFIEEALKFLYNSHKTAGISGIGREIYINDGKVAGEKMNLYKTKSMPAEAKFLGGAALYRRSCLEEAGSFNPFLKAAEEYELAQRLRMKGYGLFTIPVGMITHFTAPIGEWKEYIRKKKAGFFFGIGQMLRLCPKLSFFREALSYYSEFRFFLVYIAYFIFTIVLAVIFGAWPLYASILPLIAMLLLLFFRKKNLFTAAVSLWKWIAISFEIIKGWSAKTPLSGEYKCSQILIKDAPS